MNNQQPQNRDTALIMVVDDEAVVRAAITSHLQEAGYNIIEACSGIDAITEYRSRMPDLILMDALMPGMDGFRACKTLRGLTSNRPLPIIMLTTLAGEETAQQTIDAQATDFISKPINWTHLIHRIHVALHTRDFELELQEKRDWLAQSQELAGMGHYVYDPANDTFNCSGAIFNILDFTSGGQGASLEKFLQLIPQEDTGQLAKAIDHAIGKGEPFSLDHKMVSADGFERLVHHRCLIASSNESHKHRILGSIIDITESKFKDSLIAEQKLRDPLTNLPNRNQLETLLPSLLALSDQQEKLAGIFVLGLDRFRNIISSLGHEPADRLLIATAERLTTLSTDGITVAHLSGDEFALIANDLTTADHADAIAKQIANLFAAPFFINRQEIFLDFSIGIALYPLFDDAKEDLLKSATTAMLHAKSLGGNRFVFFSRTIGRQVSKRLDMETSLRRALERQEFEVYYQPQVALPNRRIIGMEALVRWHHPERGLILPDDFIPIAEETGLIVPIGSWVMESAARQVARWRDHGFGLLRVGINLSAKQFQDKDLAKEVQEVIHSTGITPRCLDMEITESAAMHDVERTISILEQLREMGVQSSLDDFGTGYSSLSYLQRIPLSTLKIDRSFIQDIKSNGDHGELAKIIITMGHTLGLNVIAEGVEREEQMEFLLRHQCQEAQGNLIGKPLPAVEFERLLHRSLGTQKDTVSDKLQH